MKHILALRGQAGSKKGRPTNFKSAYKGELSTSTRAVQQRDRAALRSEEEQAIEKARASDRQARSQFKKKLQKNPEYITLAEKDKDTMLKYRWEAEAEKRFNNQKSGQYYHRFLSHLLTSK